MTTAHYSDGIMSAMGSEIIGVSMVCSTVCSKKKSKLRVTGLCEGNSLVTGEFPSQRATNAENVSIWWRHHVQPKRRDGEQGPPLLFEVSLTRMEFGAWAWISDYIHVKRWNVITHPCSNFRLRHGWIIASHRKLYIWLLAYFPILIKPCYEKGPLIYHEECS